MVLSYAFCSVPVMPLRAEPSHRSEMVSQLLFGEKLEILEINDNDWARIRCAWDEYIGWCKLGQVRMISIKDYRKPIKFITNSHYNKLIINENNHVELPFGANLYGVKLFHPEDTKFKGKKLIVNNIEASPELMIENAQRYINAPYLWGGRCVTGIDCSGLTQMALKMCNIPIRRDAAQQAEEGDLVDFLQHAKKGDLAFFDNAEGKIVHVGILIDNTHIIHATETSGRVVIDKIDAEGIVSITLRRRTHKLRMIRRYM